MKAFLYILITTPILYLSLGWSLLRVRTVVLASVVFLGLAAVLYIPSDQIPTLAAREIYKGKYVPGTHAELTDRGRAHEVRYKSREPDAGEIAVIAHEDEPKVTFTRWDNKADFSVKYPGINDRGRKAFRSNLMEWRGNKKTMQAYPLDPAPGMEDGGFEIEIDLEEPPTSNVFTFELEGYEDFDFFYQPPLSAESHPGEVCTETTCTDSLTGEITRHRPEGVVGSYAVYHKELRDRVIGKHNYATGKFLHIYRPYIYDIDGNDTWGELSYENGTLSVTVPPEFLVTATYPVTVDPTFGYTSVGSSSISLKNTVVFEYASPSADGTLDSITYRQVQAGILARNTVLALYNATSETDVGSLIATTSAISVANADDDTWMTATFPSTGPSITSGTNYFLAALGSNTTGNHTIAYDTGGNTTAATTSATYPTFPNPPTGEATAAVNVSIYGTYTEDVETPYLTQNDWRWYDNANSVQPGSAKASENTSIVGVADGDILRLRMNVAVATTALATGTEAFRLQYAVGPTCSTAVTWSDVRSTSTSARVYDHWVGYNNTSATSGATTTTLLLASSTVLQSYQEGNPGVANLRTVPIGGQGEWDWVLQNNGALASTTYCFRLVTSDHVVLNSYATDGYPTLVTATSSVTMSLWRWQQDNGGEGIVTEFGTGGSTTSNPSSAVDRAPGIAADSTHIYVIGRDDSPGNAQWRIEKRDKNTGALDTSYGTNGATTTNPSAQIDVPIGIAIDDNFTYVAGIDIVGGDSQWRLEKRNKSDGALVAAFDTDGVLQSDPSANNEEASTLAIDEEYIYWSGVSFPGAGDRDWRVEKRNKTTGALVTEFGVSGVVTRVISPDVDAPYALTIDDGFIYLVGSDEVTTNDNFWRIEKFDKVTGALVTGFGSNGVVRTNKASGESEDILAVYVDSEYLYLAGDARDQTSPSVNYSAHIEKRNIMTGALCAGTSTCREGAFDTDGIIQLNLGDNHDTLIDVKVLGDHIYAVGMTELSSTDQQYWVEKRNRKTGALCSTAAACTDGVFDTDGRIIINPSARYEQLASLVLDAEYIYASGRDESIAAGNDQWRMYKIHQDNGALVAGTTSSSTWLAATNTSVTVATGTNLRLRVGVQNSGTTVVDQRYRLEFAPKGLAGSCAAVASSNFTPVPVSGSCTGSAACMANSSFLSDGERTTPQLGMSGNFTRGRLVEQANNLSATTTVFKGQYTEIEYVLQMTASSSPSTSYCFRVTDAGTAFASYTSVAELTTEAGPYALSGALFTTASATTPIPNAEVSLVIGTTTPVIATTTTNASGEFTFSPNTNNIRTDTAIVLYVNGSSTLRASLITKLANNSTSVTGLNLYRDHVVVRHEGATSTRLTDLAVYDSTKDADIQFTASTSLESLAILGSQTFYLWGGDTFIASASTTYSGGWFNNGGVYTAGPNAYFTGSSTIGGVATGSSALGNVIVTGTTTFTTNASTSDLIIQSGAYVSAPTHLTIGGDFNQYGTFVANSGTVYFAGRGEFDIDSVTIDSSFSVATEQDVPTGLAFNNDGTKMYVTGNTSDEINEYSISNPFNVSTATYVDTLSVAVQESFPTDLAFNADGTKLYVLGSGGDEINEYTLSPAYDVSTASAVDTLLVSGQDTEPTDFAFNTDGTKLFIVGNTGNSVYEYRIPTAWDVSTAVYVDAFLISTQETTPRGLTFSPDGLKMYVSGDGGDEINEYVLSVPFDISTAAFVTNLSVIPQDISPQGIVFGADGNNKLYMVGETSDRVFEYILPAVHEGIMVGGSELHNVVIQDHIQRFGAPVTSNDVQIRTTATLDAPSHVYTVGGNYTNNGTVHARAGVFMFTGEAKVLAGTLTGTSTFYDSRFTGSYSAVSDFSTMYLSIIEGGSFTPAGSVTVYGGLENAGTFASGATTTIATVPNVIAGIRFLSNITVGTDDGSPQDLAFNDDGTRMYMVGDIGNDITEYRLGVPYDPTSRTLVDTFSVAIEETVPTGMAFNVSGTKMYVVGTNSDFVNEYNLSTAWDVSTASFVDTLNVKPQDDSPTGIYFTPDGLTLFVVGLIDDAVDEYTLSTAWDVSTGVYAGTFSVATEETSPSDLEFTSDGLTMYVIGTLGDSIDEYTLSTPWDISTAVYVGTFPVNLEEVGPTGLVIDPLGTRYYIIGSSGDEVNTYLTTDSWQMLPVVTATSTFSVAGQETGPSDIAFKPDGSMFFVVGSTGDEVNSYTLTVPWDSSTATATAVFSVAGQESLANGLAFSTSGTKMFVTGYNGADVNEYTLSTPWDVTSASFVDAFSVADKESLPTSLAFNSTGTIMYIVGEGSRAVHQYLLSTPFDVSTASFVASFFISSEELTPNGLAFTSKGTRMYVAGTGDDDINEYTLSVPWQLSSAQFNGTRSVVAEDGSPQGLVLDPTGTRMYLLGGTGTDVTEYIITPINWEGDLTSASALQDLVVDSTATLLLIDDVSMQNMSVATGSYVTMSNQTLAVSGNYANNGALSFGSSTVQFVGTSTQTATGTMTGTSQFYNLSVLNTSGNGTTTQSVTFGAPVTATGTMTMIASTSVAFLGNATGTFGQVSWQGGNALSPVWLRSTVLGTPWYLTVMATKTVSYVNVRDSYASSTIGGVTAVNSTDVANNRNWTFNTVVIGSLTLANHTSGQVNNAFTHQNKTDETLYAFRLTPADESALITALTIQITGAKKIDTSRFSNLRILRDLDSNQVLSAGDVVVASSGSLTISGQNGTLAFTDDFLSTSTQNYIVVGTWTAPSSGSYMRLQLLATGLLATGQTSLGATTISGEANVVQHIRGGSNGGGSNTPGEIGGNAPAGAGNVGGGGNNGGGAIDTNTGGTTIGNETGFRWPSANSGSWNSAANAYDQTDGTYATTSSASNHSYSNYGFSIPGTDTVAGIAVKLEVSGTTAAGTLNVELSWDGGTSWTTPKTTPTMTTLDAVRTLGSESDLWGRSWSLSDFDAANFRVRVTGAPSSNTLQIDALQVRVYHQSTGGGGGGGGEI